MRRPCAGNSNCYLYSEASSFAYESDDYLVSPPISTSSIIDGSHPDMCVSFDLHMYGSDMGDLTVSALADGTNWTDIVTYGRNVDEWRREQVPVDGLVNGSNILIRFAHTSATGYWADLAIDNILIETGVPCELTLVVAPPVLNPTIDGTTLTGTGEPGATITVKDNAGTELCSATVQNDRTWSCSPNPAPVDGDTLQISQTDTRGNVSTVPASESVVVVDNTPPSARPLT